METGLSLPLPAGSALAFFRLGRPTYKDGFARGVEKRLNVWEEFP